MMFSNGTYIPVWLFFLPLAISIEFSPEEHPAFHCVFPCHDGHGFRFSLQVPPLRRMRP